MLDCRQAGRCRHPADIGRTEAVFPGFLQAAQRLPRRGDLPCRQRRPRPERKRLIKVGGSDCRDQRISGHRLADRRRCPRGIAASEGRLGITNGKTKQSAVSGRGILTGLRLRSAPRLQCLKTCHEWFASSRQPTPGQRHPPRRSLDDRRPHSRLARCQRIDRRRTQSRHGEGPCRTRVTQRKEHVEKQSVGCDSGRIPGWQQHRLPAPQIVDSRSRLRHVASLHERRRKLREHLDRLGRCG